MSACDYANRIDTERLKRRVNILMSAISALSTTVAGMQRFKIVDSYTTVAAGNYSAYDLLLVESNINGEPGLYVRGGSGTVNNASTIADSTGQKFTIQLVV